ncbi:MAG TPA: MurT ligase domain-containing protein [Chloroflexota bacterium]|nr:MurT ligase domain-containing protein [Chloroflexota bacterium]
MPAAEPGTVPGGVRRIAAVSAARLSGLVSRAFRRGGGTALPGLVALRVDPSIVRGLASQLPSGSIVISGTNGKTTTSRILGTILTTAGLPPLRNDAGSNLMRGLASSLVQQSGPHGRLSTERYRIGLFEVDEAALPEALLNLDPRCVVLLDLFRDQLDRYGEVATVARIWTAAIERLDTENTVIANADDPLVVDVASHARTAPVYFGIEDADHTLSAPEHARDVKTCPCCGGTITYNRTFLGHLGHYNCPACGFARPEPSVRATHVAQQGTSGTTFRLITPDGSADARLALPGLYNVYNAVAAVAAAAAVGVDLATTVGALANVTPAFGRMERFQIANRHVLLALAKNPTGLNEVLRTLVAADEPLHLLVMLNDNIADGRDVSWIWDADIELLIDHVASAVFSGIRAEDMALRFKYAGIVDRPGTPPWEIVHDTAAALDRALALTPPGTTLAIVPTYTALLDIYGVLVQRGFAKEYWEI